MAEVFLEMSGFLFFLKRKYGGLEKQDITKHFWGKIAQMHSLLEPHILEKIRARCFHFFLQIS